MKKRDIVNVHQLTNEVSDPCLARAASNANVRILCYYYCYAAGTMALCRTAGAGKVKGDQYYNPHEHQHHTLNVADCKHKDIFKPVLFLI